jgi:hypothetical protein
MEVEGIAASLQRGSRGTAMWREFCIVAMVSCMASTCSNEIAMCRRRAETWKMKGRHIYCFKK